MKRRWLIIRKNPQPHEAPDYITDDELAATYCADAGDQVNELVVLPRPPTPEQVETAWREAYGDRVFAPAAHDTARRWFEIGYRAHWARKS